MSRWHWASVRGPLLVAAFLHWALLPTLHAQKTSAPTRATPKTKSGGAEAGSIETLTASALKSVVVITHYSRDAKEDGVGAGFIVSPDGLIATSLHVIGEARPISVRLPDGARHEVTEIHAWDRKFDLAVIRIAAKGLPALALGDSDTLKQGTSVIALGNPLGLDHSVVQGVLSARRELEGNTMLQVAMPIEPGNSGGPLLDLKGRVHGILTLKSAITPNLGFAMPVNLLKSMLAQPNPVPIERWLTIGALSSKEWTPVFGARWSQKAGRIHVEGSGKSFGGRSLCLLQKAVPPRPYEIGVSVRLDDESGAAGLVFASDGGEQHYGFYPSAGQLRFTRFEGPTVYSWSILKQIPTEHYRPGDWNHLRVRIEKERTLGYVNGHLVFESTDDVLKEGRVGLAKFRDTRAEFKGFQLGSTISEPASSSRTEALPENLRQYLQDTARTNEAALLDELEKGGVATREALQQRARQLDKDAQRLRRLASRLHRQAVQNDLLKTLERAEDKIDLARAALLVAHLDNPDLDVESYRQQLGAMAAEILAKITNNAPNQARLDALINYLFHENGFHGSRSDYYNRANSYLNEVLDDREGLPITLSILFLELAERIGLPSVSGLPLPGHFMVRYAPSSAEEQIIDVHGGGKILTRTEAQERVIEAAGTGFRDSDYRSASKREIIVRVLRNLLGLSDQLDAETDPLRYLDLIIALVPNSVSDRFERARLRLQSGDTQGAKADFKWILDQQPRGVDLETIAELYRSL